jgi:hypothetical protein
MPRLTHEQIKELWRYLSADEILVLHHASKTKRPNIERVARAVYACGEGSAGETKAQYAHRLEIGMQRVSRVLLGLRAKLGENPAIAYEEFWRNVNEAQARVKTAAKGKDTRPQKRYWPYRPRMKEHAGAHKSPE